MKLPLTISIDMDNQWSYMKTHGDEGWEKYPTYFPQLIPVVIDTAKKLNIPLTFFFVGKDLESPENQKYVKMASDEGYSIANHSFKHEPWMHAYNREELIKEIQDTDKLIKDITGQDTFGFRGPGFSWSHELLRVLKENGFNYDCSTLPTYIGPLARFYYFRTAKMSKEERDKRNYLFGKWKEGLKRNRPYYLRIDKKIKIAEIPVTTFPIVKTPIHLSYLIYLYRIHPVIMMFYLRMAVFFLRLFRIPVSFLLHPLDFIGGDKVESLAFFPGMDMATDVKLSIVKKVISYLERKFEILDMDDFYKKVFHVR